MQFESIPIAALHAFTLDAFRRAGMSDRDAAIGADVLVTTDAWGVFTHGTKSLAGYLRRLHGKGLNPRGVPTVVSQGPAWATIDGQSSLGMVTSVMAMDTAIAKARTQGIAYAGVRNSCHFGAAGYYAWLAAQQGLIGLAVANDTPSVTAPGARGAITGSNPFAYAIPAKKHSPIILDMAISTVAGGKVYAHRQLGKPIPDNWIVDSAGRPTTDSSLYPLNGTLVPMAGHKGYGLALLIESLSGLLSGACMTWEIQSWMLADASKPTGHGAAFIAIDPKAICPEGNFLERVDALIDEIHNAPKADGSERIYVPGEREWYNHQQAQTHGIPLPPDVRESLQKAAEIAGLPSPAVSN